MSEPSQTDVQFMRHALELAKCGWGTTHPNPMVGAIIVESGAVVAEGWHKVAGQPHAEIEAFTALGREPNADAILYVTLEPCSTCGRTGACTDSIIRSGIKRVVVGTLDPNPDHAGQGINILRAAGIEVTVGVLDGECADLNLIFNHWIVNHSPLLAAKMAITLDGKFASASGHSHWVTGEQARTDVMHWRRYFPAIAVGANTVLHDDPSLTSRLDGEVWCPVRFVFDRTLKSFAAKDLPKLYTDENSDRTIVLCSPNAMSEQRKLVETAGIQLWELPEASAGHLNMNAFRNRCAEQGIVGVYIECGPSFATSLIESQLADYLFSYQAPKFMSDLQTQGIGTERNTSLMSEAIRLRGVRHKICGEDVLTRGFL